MGVAVFALALFASVMKKEILDNYWIAYDELKRRGDLYGAILKLAEIYNYLKQLDKGAYKNIPEFLQRVHLEDDAVEIISKRLARDFEKLERILTYGNVWDIDEVFLILDLRVGIDLICDFFQAKQISLAVPDFKSVDEIIKYIAGSKENCKSYSHAVALMRKNRGGLIISQYLSF
jgi:hypothetical protein